MYSNLVCVNIVEPSQMIGVKEECREKEEEHLSDKISGPVHETHDMTMTFIDSLHREFSMLLWHD